MRDVTGRTVIKLCVGLMLVGWLALCGRWIVPRGDDRAMRLIAGTEKVYSTYGAMVEATISVAPDGGHLVFAEEIEARPAEDHHAENLHAIVCSIDLSSGEKRRHAVRPDCERDLGVALSASLGLQRDAGWDGNSRFVLGAPDRRGLALTVDVDRDSLVFCMQEARELTCSDCPTRDALGVFGLLDRDDEVDVSICEAEGRPVAYYSERGILGRELNGTERVIVTPRSQDVIGQNSVFEQLRVSPDGNYMAYAVKRDLSLSPGPGSGWRYSVYVRNLRSGREEAICDRADVGNFAWSNDSKRFYFSGTPEPRWGLPAKEGRGVFCVEMSALSSRLDH